MREENQYAIKVLVEAAAEKFSFSEAEVHTLSKWFELPSSNRLTTLQFLAFGGLVTLIASYNRNDDTMVQALANLRRHLKMDMEA